MNIFFYILQESKFSMTFEILAVDIENLLMIQKQLVGHEERLHLLLLKNKFLNIFHKKGKKTWQNFVQVNIYINSMSTK